MQLWRQTIAAYKLLQALHVVKCATFVYLMIRCHDVHITVCQLGLRSMCRRLRSTLILLALVT